MTQPQLAGPLQPEEPPQPLQQQAVDSSTASAAVVATVTASAAPVFHKPAPLASLPSSTTVTNAAILKGIAASALEQPTDDTNTASSSSPSPSKPNLQPPPNLRVSTNISSLVSIKDKFSATHSSGRAESALPSRMGGITQSSKATGESTPLGLTPQSARPNFGTSGKRPSMRHITAAQSEMTPAEKEARSQKIRDIINEQFGLEILLKHRELQDIEAELGKAEACLEQIRRCSIEEAMEKDGRFEEAGGTSIMYTPSPHVLDGPYSREYRDWLMEDRVSKGRTRFHDVLAPNQTQNFIVGPRNGRQEVQQSSKRPQREAAVVAQSQKRPTICLHRQLDGSIVKLSCIDCKRDTFGSMQGFINHCRLAHQRDFQTHDHAAAACGVPFDVSKYDGPMPPPRSNKASKYASSSAISTVPKPARPSVNTKAAPKAAPKATPKANKKKNGAALVTEALSIIQTGPLTPPLQAEDITLQKTIQTSHLKEYLSKKQVDVENLDTMVEEAVNRVGMVEESEGEDDEAEEVTPPEINLKQPKMEQKLVEASVIEAKTVKSATAEPRVLQPQAMDVEMADVTVEVEPPVETHGLAISTGDQSTTESAVLLPARDDMNTIVDNGEASAPVQVFTPDNKTYDEEEQQRPTSRRSNPGSRQSPRTPVAPPPAARMGTRAHPSPDADQHHTRHSARLAETGRASPGKRT